MPSVFKILLPIFALVAATLHAQSVHWEPGSGTLAYNQPNELSLVFEQCSPTGTVTPPAVNGLMFGSPSSSTRTSFNVVNLNATTVRTVTLTFGARPTERATLVIPAFTVETDKGRQQVASATFEVEDATVGQTGLSLGDIASAAFSLPETAPWQGQVFDLHYNLSIKGSRPFRAANNLTWNNEPLVVETWGAPVQNQVTRVGQPLAMVTQSTRAFSRKPGPLTLAPAEQDVIIATGQDVFGRPTGTNFTISSAPATLTVRPLPAPAPAGFNGAVGKFTLDSKVVPATAAVGEPITWTLTLDGTGNWPDITGLPSRSVSKDFRVVQPQAKRANKDNALFDASITEDIVLIPTKPGAYTLGPVAYTVFNPATGAYETLSTQPVTIQIAAAAPPPATTTTPHSTGTAAPANSEGSTLDVGRSPAAPSPIPRDPLPPADTATAPLSHPVLLTSLASSALVPLFLWMGLALRRARLTDPARALREAHIRLANTLRQLAEMGKPETGNLKPEVRTSEPQVSALLRAWQRDTAILWRIPQAVPTPASFSSERSGERERPGSATWSDLWSEADRTLYGTAPLPADWTTRASQALAAHRAPTFSPFQLFLPRNILPLFIVIASLITAHASYAADARDSYAKGDFATAGAAWTDTLKTEPTDWAAHHNLALTLIQQNHPGEAAGHALAAFVQQPQNTSVRWHLAYAFKAAGVAPAAITPFLTDTSGAQLSTLNAQLAALASPTRWQAALIASAWLTALALSLGFYGAYQKRPRKWLVRSLLLPSVLLAVAATVSLRTYDALADAQAVVVVTPTTLRSIPTDLDTPQKTTPLALGVIAKTDKTFLGWRRLVFPDGQTGWVRAETLVALWK